MKRLLLSFALLAVLGCAAKNPAKTPAPPLAAAPTKPVAASDPEPFRAARPEPGPKATFDYPAPDELTLPNGLRVYLVPRASHVVALDFVLRSGAAESPVKKSGLASLTARMLTEGTRHKSSAALAEAVESLGTTLGADTSRDDSSLSLTVLPDDLPRALGLLAEVVTEPAFAENDFQRVRAEWLDGLRAERQDPSRLASLVAVRLAIGMVEGAPIDGALSDVEALTTKELREFHKQHYTPDNAALVVVGPFTKNELSPLVSQAFAGWRGKLGAPVKAEPPALPLEKTRLVLVDRPGSVQSAIVALDPGPKRSDPGHEAREVVGRILGGLFTSRLNTNLREKHAYTYGAFARSVESRNWGALLVSTSVRTDATAPSLDEIFVELKKLSNPTLGAPITAPEILRAKSDLVFSLGATLEHPSRVANATSDLFVDALPLDYYARYSATLAALTATEIEATAARTRAQGLTVVVVGDRAKIEPELRQHGYSVEIAASELSE